MPSKNSPGPLAPVRKMVAAGLGLVGQLVALNVLHGSALQVATGLLAGGVLLGVYAAPNTGPAATARTVSQAGALSGGESPAAPLVVPTAPRTRRKV